MRAVGPRHSRPDTRQLRTTTVPFVSSLKITCFFFFNDTATTEIYTLSLHDALPISANEVWSREVEDLLRELFRRRSSTRSEEHTSELQSRPHLVCRLLLEKKNT